MLEVRTLTRKCCSSVDPSRCVCLDENVPSSKNLSHFRLSALDARCRGILREGRKLVDTLMSLRLTLDELFQIQVISGVVLISWRQAVLQRQIDYGAKLGHGEHPVCMLVTFLQENSFTLSSCPFAGENGTRKLFQERDASR